MDLKPPLENVISDSTHPTVTPDPRWPSKCRWSIESPPPAISTGTVSTAEKSNAGSELSSPSAVNDDNKVMRHQIDVMVLESNPVVSSETPDLKQIGESDSVANPELVAAGDNTFSDITSQPENKEVRNTCVQDLSLPQSPGLPPITFTSPEISVESPIATFVPSLGAWAKPLAFIPPATPPTPATPSGFDPHDLNNLLDSFWPTLADGFGPNQNKKDHPSAVREFPRMPVQKIPVPELKDDGTLRFPWAARMDPATRNLYRAAKPTFRLDGTPEVTIPSQVLRLGPENKKEYIIGHFHRCSLPPGGLIHAVVNRLWGRTCRIGCRKLSETSYMFHIPHDSTRQWVIQRGVWHVDDCLLFVSPWKPVNSFKVPEVSTIPVWVTLKNVPDCCYSRLGLSHVASGLGEPMQTHKPRLDPTCLGEAKLLVEVELDKPFPKQIALDDKQGNIYLVDVEYTWIPSVCGRCGHLGHKEKRCLLPAVDLIVETRSTHEDLSAEEPLPEMGIILAESTVASEAENLESQVNVEPKHLSTPVNNPTHSKVDLLDFIDWSGVQCLNQSSTHSLPNALKQGYREDAGLNLESDADEQLLIYIPFNQVIKLHSFAIKGPEEEGPKTVKFFSNKEHMCFSNVNDFPPSDNAELTEENLKGKPVVLKYVKFQNVRSLTIFIEDNQSDSEVTKVQKIALYGSTVETTDMKGLKKIEDH